MTAEAPIRVRFAPSPTGHLHIGGLRAAIFNWLFARHNKGKFLLRIEDTDPERSKQEYTDSIIASLAWAHVDWDEPYIVQSQRIGRHQEVVQTLLAQKKAYYCMCTQADVIERLSGNPNFDANFIKYDGYCWRNQAAVVSSQKPKAIRFRLPETPIAITWDDLVRGPISFGIDQLDDFIIVRSDGTFMYNFVVIIDDADSSISHVIRGEDHISNTPKQILLYHACNFPVPYFAHLPMILGPDGNRLSKRDAATSVFEYKEGGYLPQALFNYLVRLGWSHGDQEIFTQQEMISFFSLDHVGKKGAIFDQTKLDWINGVYMRNTSDQELLDTIIKDVKPSFLTDLPRWHTATVLLLINIYKQRAKTLRELAADIMMLYGTPQTYVPEDIAQWVTRTTADELEGIAAVLRSIEPFGADALSAAVKEWTKNKNIKMVAIAQPLRIALLGKSSGPGVFELMAVLGKQETMNRLASLIRFIQAH